MPTKSFHTRQYSLNRSANRLAILHAETLQHAVDVSCLQQLNGLVLRVAANFHPQNPSKGSQVLHLEFLRHSCLEFINQELTAAPSDDQVVDVDKHHQGITCVTNRDVHTRVNRARLKAE